MAWLDTRAQDWEQFPGFERAYRKVLVPEINLGQLQKLVRAEFLVDATGFNLVRGIPFRAGEVADAIDAMVDS